MAKPLTLTYHGETVNFDLDKVDRTKLYGRVETQTLDDAGRPCELGTLIGDGHSIVGKGGSAIAVLSPDGHWRRKADLTAVDVAGNPIIPVKSSFNAPIDLEKTATVDEYLNHAIGSVYQLRADETNAGLAAELAAGTIFTFPFSYRGGLEPHTGFLLRAADGTDFIAIGTPTTLEYVGLATPAAAVADPDEPAADDDDLDFNLV
jgi:hypothetical protein